MAEHKVIEKADSEEEKKKRKLLVIKIIPVAVLAFILIAVSLAWFTIDKALDLDSFGMKSVDSPKAAKADSITKGSAVRIRPHQTNMEGCFPQEIGNGNRKGDGTG